MGDIPRGASERLRRLTQQERVPDKEANTIVEKFYGDLRAKLGLGRPQDDDLYIVRPFTVGGYNFLVAIDKFTEKPSDQNITLIMRGPKQKRIKIKMFRPKEREGCIFTINDNPKSENTRSSARKVEEVRKRIAPIPDLSARKAAIEEAMIRRTSRRVKKASK